MISVPDALARFPGSTTFTFGDSHRRNVEILRLIASGYKTVECEAVANYEKRGDDLPEPGRVQVALHNNGLPVLAIRTLEVSQMKFNEMTEELVDEQGEYRNLYEWQQRFEGDLTSAGMFAPDAMIVVQRFEVADRFW